MNESSDPESVDKNEPLSTQHALPSYSSEAKPLSSANVESAPAVEQTTATSARFYLNLARPHVTYTLIALNVLAFIGMIVYGYLFYDTWRGPETMGVLIDLGAKVNDFIVDGQTWRLLSATFLHIGAMHLLFNLYALYALGPLVEGYFGHARFLAIYIVAGLLGSIASFAFSSAVSAGASGAVFGLAGATIVYFLRYRDNFGQRGRAILQNMFVVIGLNLVFGLSMSNIDNWGHMGGLVGGAVAAWGLLPRYADLTTMSRLPQNTIQSEPQSIPEDDRMVWNIGWVIFCGALLWLLFEYAAQIAPLIISN